MKKKLALTDGDAELRQGMAVRQQMKADRDKLRRSITCSQSSAGSSGCSAEVSSTESVSSPFDPGKGKT